MRGLRQVPPGLAALAASGALLGHEIGYLTDRDTLGHDYLGVAGPIVLIGVVVMVWRTAVNVVRRTQDALPSLTTLAATQTALYLSFEIGERLVGDTGSSLWSVPVIAGLAAQTPVAWLALRLVRLGTAALEALIDRPANTAAPARRPAIVVFGQPMLALIPRTVSARGPPPLIATSRNEFRR